MHKLIKNTPIFRADLGKKAFFGLSRRRREKNRHFVIRTRLNFKVLGIKFNFSPSWGGGYSPHSPPLGYGLAKDGYNLSFHIVYSASCFVNTA